MQLKRNTISIDKNIIIRNRNNQHQDIDSKLTFDLTHNQHPLQKQFQGQKD